MQSMIHKHIYWLVSKPHCDRARKVKQTDGKIAYVCEHKTLTKTRATL